MAALTDPQVLAGLRNRFSRLDRDDGLRELIREVVDPQLLRIVLGPALEAVWVPLLEGLYARMRRLHPAHFHDVDNAWATQRRYWMRLVNVARKQAEATDASESEDSAAAGAHGEVAERRTAVEPRASGGDSRRAAESRVLAAPPRRAGDPLLVDDDGVPLPGQVVVEDSPPSADLDESDESPEPRAARPAAPLRSSSVSSSAARPAKVEIPAPRRGGASLPAARPSQSAAPSGRAALISADPGVGVAGLVSAMTSSKADLDRYRRHWIRQGGSAPAWDRWSLPDDLEGLVRARALGRSAASR